jgi:hypothetical protein
MPAIICLKGIIDGDIVELDESLFECGHVRVSIFRFLGQHAFDDVAECGGQISAESREGWWQFSEVLDGDGHWIFTGNGGCPANMCHAVIPREYWSERWSSGRPSICSGLMYQGVPMVVPA